MNSIIFESKSVVPSKVVCVARNYVEHIRELNNAKPEEMALFIKPNSSISRELRLPEVGLCHYEAEISFIVTDNRLRGVGFGLDLTLRDLQKQLKEKGLPWEKSKAFDGSAVFSRFIDFDGDISNLGIELYINDRLVQKGDVSMMIHKPEEILDHARGFFTFFDYDILMTGTPAGVGPFERGDLFLGRLLYKGEEIIRTRWVVK